MQCAVYLNVIIPRVKRSLSIKLYLNTVNRVPCSSTTHNMGSYPNIIVPLNQIALPNKETKITVLCFVCRLTFTCPTKWVFLSSSPLVRKVNEAELWTYGSNTWFSQLLPHCSPHYMVFIPFTYYPCVVATEIWAKFQSLDIQHTVWPLSNFMFPV